MWNFYIPKYRFSSVEVAKKFVSTGSFEQNGHFWLETAEIWVYEKSTKTKSSALRLFVGFSDTQMLIFIIKIAKKCVSTGSFEQKGYFW